MNVETISVPLTVVNEKLREYRRGLHRKADAEWQRVVTAYEAAASGKPLIVLSNAIANCPRDEMGRPKLAIARADRRSVRYRRHRSESSESFSTENRSQWGSVRGKQPIDAVIRVPVIEGVTPPFVGDSKTWMVEGTALVPMVPPSAGRHDLARHFVLWEVPAWTPAPPVDPYLLRKVADDLYVVEAEWDLTEIERAVMASRARA
jgi:hypothetical protein